MAIRTMRCSPAVPRPLGLLVAAAGLAVACQAVAAFAAALADEQAGRVEPLAGGAGPRPRVVIPTAPPSAWPIDDELRWRRLRLQREAGRPEAAAALFRLLSLWDQGDPMAIVELLRRVADGRRTHPLVRGRATFLLATALERLGRLDQARRRIASLGLVTDFLVIGPFDNEGRAGFDRVYPPESEAAAPPSPGMPVAGKERPVAWRRLPAVAYRGYVPLDAVLRPDSAVVGYAWTVVHSRRAQAAALRVGSSGAIKLWLNGELVFGRDVYRPPQPDQDAAPVELRRGANSVLVKVGAGEGPWGFYLRLTSRQGDPLPGLKVALPDASAARGSVGSLAASRVGIAGTAAARTDSSAAAAPGGATASAVRSRPRSRPALDIVRSLPDLLRQTAGANPDSARAHEDLARVLLDFAADDSAQRTAWSAAARAVELDPTVARLRLLADAETVEEERRRILERALALSARPSVERARVLAALAEMAYDGKREERAEALFAEAEGMAAAATSSAALAAALGRARLLADRGLPSLAAQSLSEVEPRFARALSLLRERARLEERRGRKQQAEELWRRCLGLAGGDLDALRNLASAARNRGDSEAALRLLGELQSIRPDLTWIRQERAEILEGSGRMTEAIAEVEAATAQLPDEPRLKERLGRLLLRAGRRERAIDSLRQALSLRPQDAELRDYLAHLSSASGSDLAKSFRREVALLRERARLVTPAEGETARVLLQLSAVRVHANGLSQEFSQRVIEILEDRGGEEQGEFEIRYAPDSQAVEVRAARVHRADGEVLELSSRDERSVSEPWYGLYYDYRALVLRFPGLRKGDVVDIEYLLSDQGRRNLLGDYYGELFYFQESLSRLESEYVLLTPPSRRFYFNRPSLDGLLAETKDVAGERLYRFRAGAVPRVQPEPGMPGWGEVAAYLHVSTYQTWQEVAAWYWGLTREQLIADAAIREAAAAAVRGIDDQRGKVRAIYELVVKRTRYVGLEFGIHGYKPYPAPQVFGRKFGDCKDKAALLVTMLREVGIAASMVLVRTRRGGAVAPAPASLAVFDHAIAYVPSLDLYLDGTAEWSGAGELPTADQGVMVLHIDQGRGELRRTPILPAGNNRAQRTTRALLDQQGDATVGERLQIEGAAAADWREFYQVAGERRERYEKASNRVHPGASVRSVSMPALEDLGQPVRVEAELRISGYGRLQAGGIAVPLLGRESELARTFARLSQRKHALILDYPWQQEEEIVFRPPPGFALHALPVPRVLEGRFGRVQVETARGDHDEARIRVRLEVRASRLECPDYQAFRRFLVEADTLLNQEVGFARKPT